jgi:hypothetical protein
MLQLRKLHHGQLKYSLLQKMKPCIQNKKLIHQRHRHHPKRQNLLRRRQQ